MIVICTWIFAYKFYTKMLHIQYVIWNRHRICIVGARVRFLACPCGGRGKDFHTVKLAKVTAQLENVVGTVGVERLVQHRVLHVAEIDSVRTEHLLLPGLLHVNPPLQTLPVHSTRASNRDMFVVLGCDDGSATALLCCSPALLVRRCELRSTGSDAQSERRLTDDHY